jgi:VWFA-related protein
MRSRLQLLAALSIGVLTCAAAGHAQQAQQNAPQQQNPPQQQEPPPQQPPSSADQQQPAPTFRAEISFVRVDVIVTDKDGNHISDLQPGDFEITEEGQPQKVETFKLVELDAGLLPSPDGPPRPIRNDYDEEREAARDDVRLFGVFLDDYHVRQGSSMSAREQIARFIETQLGPSDMVGLMYPLEPASNVRFTRNHDAVRRGIERFLGRKFDYTPQNTYEEQYAYYPTEIVEKIRNQVSMSAIEALISRMGALKEGRKALILVSEGYSNILPPQMRNPVAALGGIGNPAARDPQAGDNDPREFQAQAFASFDLMNELRDLWSAANRHNVAIYTVDPRGLATNEFDINERVSAQTDRAYLSASLDTLRTLAEQTDGRAIVNRNDLTAGMRQIVRDTSAYYLLGYTSTLAPTDGKFHEIRVRVNRPGVQVRARKGYWALTPEDVARVETAAKRPETPKAVAAAVAGIGVTAKSRLVRTWLGTSRGDAGKTRVTFVWEPTPRVPGQPVRAGEQPSQVSISAIAADGSPLYRGRASAAATRLSFDVPPGAMQVRIAVEGSGSEVLDSETREVTVPDLTVPQVTFGTPEVFRARTVREAQTQKADPNAAPTPAREFSRTERIVIRVPAYGAGTARPELRARLLNRTGQAMSDLPVAPASDAMPASIDLALAGLAPGEYVVEITAGGDGSEATELIGFRVAS